MRLYIYLLLAGCLTLSGCVAASLRRCVLSLRSKDASFFIIVPGAVINGLRLALLPVNE